MPKSVLAAAIAKLEAEKQSRIEEKIAKGEAVRVPPIVVGSPGSVNAEKARRLAELRGAGETREVIFGFRPIDGSGAIEVIVTGVPRRGRDVDIPATEAPKPVKVADFTIKDYDA
jgi:hypothetical protein